MCKPEELEALNRKMSDFYSKMESRSTYQSMLDSTHEEGAPVNKYSDNVAGFISKKSYQSVLEVGCGNGQFYELLRKHGYSGKYTGVEMAPVIIKKNREKFKDASWDARSVYELDGQAGQFDCCVSLFVLEHLVYPEKGLEAMMNKVKKGGELILVFPDFQQSTIFPSQKIGIRHGKMGTVEKIKHLYIFDAIVGFIEGRIVANALRKVNLKYGDFVVNTLPYCLVDSNLFPDSDAIYISNRREIAQWAGKLKYLTEYPCGTEGDYSLNAFMVIRKS
jgi:2-polyprenyl-3-methyl-5-hydroxy-6-metoxy-1,4-benzoquinol methylase